jgi:hypothetical protein
MLGKLQGVTDSFHPEGQKRGFLFQIQPTEPNFKPRITNLR